MSISTGRLSFPRKVESLSAPYRGEFTLELIDGKLSSFLLPNQTGEFDFQFSTDPSAPPRSGSGSLKIGSALNVPSLAFQMEAGPKEGAWSTWASLRADGLDSEGRLCAFRSIDSEDTSLIVEFAAADSSAAGDRQAVLSWQAERTPTAPASDDGDFSPLFAAWVKAQGVNVAGLESFIRSLGEKVHAHNAAEKVVEWIAANVATKLDPQTVLAIAIGAIAELKGGNPGYNKDHGGLA